MRIVIDMGHTPTSPGASGYLDELTCDRLCGRKVIAELRRRGHEVYDSTAPDSMAYPAEVNYRSAYANALNGIDLFCSIHLNAGGGTGTEVLYRAGDATGRAYAERISAKVAAAFGLTDRGAKANDWVGVIVSTRPTPVLIELCFVDNSKDAAAWYKMDWTTLVNAICNGIDGTEGDDMATAEDVWGYDWENTAPQGNMYNCNVAIYKMVESMERKLDALSAKVDKIQVGGVDRNALKKDIADEIAARMKS